MRSTLAILTVGASVLLARAPELGAL